MPELQSCYLAKGIFSVTMVEGKSRLDFTRETHKGRLMQRSRKLRFGNPNTNQNIGGKTERSPHIKK